MTCKCCGRLLSQHDLERKICTYCGMYVFTEDNPAKTIASRQIAEAYRMNLIENITDISLVSPDDRIFRLCDAKDCYENIVWSKYPLAEWWPAVDLRMKVRGKEQRFLLENMIEEDDRSSKIGIAIDRKLNLFTYFGNERFHISKGPYNLRLY